ncbi:unnamed protein product [Protopolystoma xenopodis]|uniref:Uncharacterized protein n=1 Tax=Protopolystoma xenopodis TaxID=117903 RepID=A0A3S5CPU7_9PLAT|nr:unnamed protein product [Protopolystoma xenopodis]
MMLRCSNNVRHMTDESLVPFIGIEEDYVGSSVRKNLPVKPINSWSRGIRRRLLVELTVESLNQTPSLEMEVSSTMMKQEVPRNPTFLRRRELYKEAPASQECVPKTSFCNSTFSRSRQSFCDFQCD